MQVYDVHISDVMAFKSCRRRWDFSSSLRRNLTSLGIYAPFFTGRIIHAALDNLYKYGVEPVTMVAELVVQETNDLRIKQPDVYKRYADLITEQMWLCTDILNHYWSWRQSYNGPYADPDFDFLTTEQAFNEPMRTPKGRIAKNLRLAGRFDGLVRYKKDDAVYLWEIKTTRSISERIKMLELEEQCDAYCIAAEEMLGERVHGVVYTLIRKKTPDEIPVLKSGMLSQNKAIDTTAELYIECVRTHHGHVATREFIKEHYGEIINHLLQNGKPFFQRVVVKRSIAHLANYRQQLYTVAREMTNPRIPIYHHGQYSCNYCVFREPCLAIQRGDVALAESILATQFVQNTYHLIPTDEE